MNVGRICISPKKSDNVATLRKHHIIIYRRKDKRLASLRPAVIELEKAIGRPFG
jgi:hypothetical protein